MSFKSFLVLALAAIFSVERNQFYKFCNESPKKYFCEIILKSEHWPRRRCSLKVFCFSSVGHFSQRGGTIIAIMVECHPRSEIILKWGHWHRRRCRLNVFLVLALIDTLFSGAEPF